MVLVFSPVVVVEHDGGSPFHMEVSRDGVVDLYGVVHDSAPWALLKGVGIGGGVMFFELEMDMVVVGIRVGIHMNNFQIMCRERMLRKQTNWMCLVYHPVD